MLLLIPLLSATAASCLAFVAEATEKKAASAIAEDVCPPAPVQRHQAHASPRIVTANCML